MPSIEEIKLALGTMDKSSNASSINENVVPTSFSQELFAPIEKLEDHIHDRDGIIENLEEEIFELKNQISILEKEKSNILEELKKSGWLENKVTFSSKYKGNMKTILGEVKVVDTKIISLLTTVGRKKQGNEKLTWKGWLTIPENRYLYEINESIAKDVYNATTEYIRKNWEDRKISRGGGKKEQESVNYSLTFSGNTGDAAESYATTDFNPDDYDLHLGCTVSYWVRPDEVGNTMFAFGRKHSNDERFTFGINRKRQGYFAIGSNRLTTSWVNMDTPVEESLLEKDGSYWNLKTDGTWYHFVLTYDDRTDTSSGAERKLYVNGVLRHTNTINWSDTGGGTSGMMFGGRNLTGDYNNGWACAVDQVAIFDTEKSADWVAGVYSTGQRKLNLQGESGLVGYWKFSEGGGTTVADLSGNGNHGTFAPISGDTTAYPTWEKLK